MKKISLLLVLLFLSASRLVFSQDDYETKLLKQFHDDKQRGDDDMD